MIVLGMDTATPVSTVCVGDESGSIAAASLSTQRSHAEFLLPAVEFCLHQSGLSMDQISGITVGLGPGLYTGLRVGLATAQGLAHARGLPMVGFSSLDLVAFSGRMARPDRVICAVLDARRKELFWAMYRPAQTGVLRITEPQVGPIDRLAADIEALGDEVLCIGDGALVYDAQLQAAGAAVASVSLAHPDARALVELAVPRFIREETQRAEELAPVYLRGADAKIQWSQRGVFQSQAVR